MYKDIGGQCMKKKWTILSWAGLLLLFVMGSMQTAQAAKTGKAVPAEGSAAYWCSRTADGEQPLLKTKDVVRLNAEIRSASSAVCALQSFPQTLAGSKVTDYIAGSLPEPGTYYRNGELLAEEDFDGIMDRTVVTPVAAEVKVRYAVTVKRADLRLLPMAEAWLKGAGPTEAHDDALQATAVDPSEPVAVLADSDDGAYVFVQMRYDRGWLDKKSLAFTDRKTWLNYVEPKRFLVVTKNRYTVESTGGAQLYQLGSRMLLNGHHGRNWVVRVPQQRYNGMLLEGEAVLPMDAGSLHAGWLPYTRNNILCAAFTLLGDTYGWGGMEQSVDASSLLADVYRTVGIELPRTSSQQERVFTHKVDLTGLSTGKKYQTLLTANPGDVVFLPGHAMLYLGRDAMGEPRVLHALDSCYQMQDGWLQQQTVRKAAVTDLFLLDAAGKTMLSMLSGIGAF